MRREKDPYAPPPRHRDSSGAVVRFAIIAALLGAAAWGYTEYAQQPQTALVEPAEEQRMAESGYAVTTPAPPETATPTGQTPEPATPAEVPERAAEPPG
jgi:hypothetical protein